MQIKPKFLSILLILSLAISIVALLEVTPLVSATGITHVVGQSGRGTIASGTSITVTMAATPASGNLLISGVGWCESTGAVTVSSITETGVTWTGQVSKNNGWDNSAIWVGVVGAGASKTVTITLSGSGAQYGAVADIYEYSGLLTTGFLDKTASNAGGTASPNTGTTATTTQATELWIGVTEIETWGQSTPTNLFTLYDGAEGSNAATAFLEKIVSSTGTANSGTTVAGANGWTGCIATFKGVGDTTSPTFGTVSATNTLTSTSATITCTVSDDVAVSFNSVRTNNTGSWAGTNQTAQSGGSASLTLTWNGTVGNHVGVQIWANDTSNNVALSSITYFTLTASGWTKTFEGTTTGNIEGVPRTQIGSVDGVP